MIDLRGMTQEQAEKAIVGLGLTVGTVDHSSSDMPAGQVWFQSVEPKDEVAPGTKVNIIISTGSAGGSQQNSKTITFNLPDSGEIVSVQVIDSSGNTVWGPVSYTHLDVYKRQPHCCPSTGGLPPSTGPSSTGRRRPA